MHLNSSFIDQDFSHRAFDLKKVFGKVNHKTMASKPSIPKGTRDFSPAEVAKRNYIIRIIKNQFREIWFPTYRNTFF